MSSINYDLTKIKAFIFDVDGVLSPSIIPMNNEGEPMRMLNVKDRYAITRALQKGFPVGIITGAKTFAVRAYYEQLGIKYLYMQSSDKYTDLTDFIARIRITLDEIVYSGDDMPDLEVMSKVGLSVSPSDAAYEIRAVAKYITHLKGGEGIARDVIEQVLKAQNKW